MKRHPALAPLSHGHQHTLAVAQRLRRATPDTAAQAVAAFLAVWDLEERQHVRLERKCCCRALPVILTLTIR
jgi:hypothetical protein